MKTPTPDFKVIPLNEISTGKTNPRSAFDLESTTELSQSIAEKGIIQSLTVRPHPNLTGLIKYELVCGERRYRASVMLHENGHDIAGVPCMIRELSDSEVIELQITENLQRKDVHPMDEAVTFKSLVETHNFTSDEIAKRLGKTVFYVNQRLKLSELIDEFQAAFFKNRLSFSLALKIAKFSQDIQKKIWDEEVDGSIEENEVIRLGLHDFKTYLGNLSEASFDLTDETLNAKCGACTSCPFNTATASLFPEDAKSPRCLNAECFETKEKEHLTRELNKSLADPEVAIISTSYHIDSKDKHLIKKAEQHKVHIYSHGEFSLIDSPEKPDLSDFEERLNDGNFVDYNAMTDAFNEEMLSYEKELEAYKEKILNPGYVKAFVLLGNDAGKYVYVTLKKKSNKKSGEEKNEKGNSGSTTEAEQKITSAELHSEITRLKEREIRAKQLDQEKVYPLIYENLKKDELYKQSIEALGLNELIAFIIFLTDCLGTYNEFYEKFILKTLGFKKIKDEFELLTILKSKSIKELKELINQFSRLLVVKTFVPKDGVRFDNTAYASILKDVAEQYDEHYVNEAIANQAAAAHEREERVNAKIQKAEKQLQELKSGTSEKKPEKKKSEVKAEKPQPAAKKETPKKKATKKKPAKKSSGKKSSKKK